MISNASEETGMAEKSADRPVAEPVSYLTFWVAGEEYGIRVLQVREIIEYGAVTRVPSTPPWIRGVVNLRGSVLPVIDLAVKFGQPPSPVTRWTCIVVTEISAEQRTTVLGVIADAVSQVLDLGPQDIEPPPPFGTPVRVEFLLGLGRAQEKFILLLDTDRVLSADELLAAQRSEEAAAQERPVTPPAGPDASRGGS
jgi:purine-binding chemotaxis protein CheW